MWAIPTIVIRLVLLLSRGEIGAHDSVGSTGWLFGNELTQTWRPGEGGGGICS